MTPWMRMLLPVGFGVVAAIINFVVLKQLNQQVEFVSVGGKIHLAQGTPFTPSNIKALKVSGDVAKLNKAWVRWEDRDTIYGRPAGRTLVPGEMVLRQDAQPVQELKPHADEDAMVLSLGSVEVEPKLLLIGEDIGFLIKVPKPVAEETSPKPGASKISSYNKPEPEVDIEYLGPFRLLSVGDRLSRNVGESKKEGRGEGRTVTIAIQKIKEKQKLEDKVERLVRATTPKSANKGESDLLKLVLHRSLPKIEPPVEETEGNANDTKKEGENTTTDGTTEASKGQTGDGDSSSSTTEPDPDK